MDYAPPLPDPGTGTIRRYVATRYLDLLGGDCSGMRDDAAQISDAELTFLLQPGGMGNWRPRLVAAYLIATGRRVQFRETLGELLLASEVCYSGKGYCVALAAFGTPRDAEILIAYLERYLPRAELRYDQDWAMGALVHLDRQLGTGHAERFLGTGGPWDGWAGAVSHPPDFTFCLDHITNVRNTIA
ncbi:DUF6000 family protein [Dactylosporangium sp. CS-047395]|uniref:DUF6000 family protein n=1 Tax=Dactylosporangium sp. CS-047395 TaxID=3239936 RepID=UPI003D8FA52E